MTATRPMGRKIAAASRANTAQVEAVIKLFVDGHTKLTWLFANALAIEADAIAGRTQRGSHGGPTIPRRPRRDAPSRRLA
jgi:hypothetical protein